MDPDILTARLALSKGWITRGAYQEILERARDPASSPLTLEDALRAAGLSGDQLGELRRALHIRRDEVWIGDWKVLRRVGIGGMGSVFEARHRRTGRRAALKILLPRLGREPEFTARFVQEAKALARISHPNVVHAFDAGKSGEFHFIAMELVEGEDLQRILEREGRLDPNRSAGIMLGAARGLEAIEAAGLVHRDLKPANILIDVGGAVKLTDLGLFRAGLESDLLRDGMFFGTPQYMPPEQVLGKPGVDIRSDLYSLGATWYHAIVGRPPFERDSLFRVARAQVEDIPVPPREIRPEIPDNLDRLILVLLEKDPALRPPGPRVLASAIEEILLELGGRKTSDPAPLPISSRENADRSWGLGLRGPAFLALGILCAVLVLGFGYLLQRQVFREDGGEAVRGGLELRREEVDLGKAREAMDSVGSAALDLARRLDRFSRRLIDSAAPEFLLRAFAGGGTGASPSSLPPPSPSPRAPEALPAILVSPKVLEWTLRGAAEARSRFFQVLSAPGFETIEVLLLDGSAVKAKVLPSNRPVLQGPDGREIPVVSLHPASVIVWGLSDPGDPIPDGGVGLAIASKDLWIARMIIENLSQEVPADVRAFLAYEEDQGPPGPVRDFLSRSLRDIRDEREGRAHLAGGRYGEAALAFRSLLAREDPSPIGAGRRTEWVRLEARARWLSFAAGKFFAGTASPLDPFRGEALRIRYGFDDPGELRDFRLDGLAFKFGEGAIERRAGAVGGRKAGREKAGGRTRPAGSSGLTSPLDTVAIFVLPVTVEGLLRPAGGKAGRIAIAFADRFVAFSPGAILATWKGELGDGRLPKASAPSPSGKVVSEDPPARFRVEFLEDRAVVEFPGPRREEVSIGPAGENEAPPLGRIAIGLDPDSMLEELTITGTLDPVWAEARIDEIEKGTSR